MTRIDDSRASPPESGCLYFAYGSNLWREQMERRTGNIPNAVPARLDGYRLAFNKPTRAGGVAANVVPSAGDAVWGVVYRCTDSALLRLDGYEPEYQRRTVTVHCADETMREAVAYIAESPVDERRPCAEYLARILRGASEHGLPDEYIDWIGSFGS